MTVFQTSCCSGLRSNWLMLLYVPALAVRVTCGQNLHIAGYVKAVSAFDSLPKLRLVRCWCRLEAHPSRPDCTVIAVHDTAIIQAVKNPSGSANQDSAAYNMVQESLWPQNASAECTEEAPDTNDQPGSWSSVSASRGPAGLPHNGYMAHTMQVGQVLRPVPVPSAGLLQVTPQAFYSTIHPPQCACKAAISLSCPLSQQLSICRHCLAIC